MVQNYNSSSGLVYCLNRKLMLRSSRSYNYILIWYFDIKIVIIFCYTFLTSIPAEWVYSTFEMLKFLILSNTSFGRISGCPILRWSTSILFYFAFSAYGTSFLIGDSGIFMPFEDIFGIFYLLRLRHKLRIIFFFWTNIIFNFLNFSFYFYDFRRSFCIWSNGNAFSIWSNFFIIVTLMNQFHLEEWVLWPFWNSTPTTTFTFFNY